ncbi:MAG: beta-eliminating lyase-related protein [Gemmatimonadota bacterium]|nr:beta-eliminating lyase-related protein [Gemmatimonadota bacterium]MDH3421914.1 beta-eliminating lyase-related protein [Gemmatimonadota bacterium]
MIDLRSDTVTKPTPGMRAAMAAADVGDDVYGEDPAVNELEARTAQLLGKEDAVFVPTGTMSNQIGIRIHTEPGDLALVEGTAHIVANEGGGAAAISGVTIRPLRGVRGVFTADEVDAAVGVSHPFKPTTLSPPPRLLCVENTHNAGGGTVWPLESMHAVCQAGRRHGLALHLDGARLWHASAASGVTEREFAEPFDTVNVCFSKGLGAPVGSALAGGRALIARARRFKQQFGGGMRQAGVLAASALYALENHRPHLAEDVRRAQTLAKGLATLEGIDIDPADVHSNIVRFSVTSGRAPAFAEACHAAGVHMIPGGARGVRAVLHRDISDEDVARALDQIASVLPQAVPSA